jgi:hypothetical protein
LFDKAGMLAKVSASEEPVKDKQLVIKGHIATKNVRSLKAVDFDAF